jgi:hypothetical protein
MAINIDPIVMIPVTARRSRDAFSLDIKLPDKIRTNPLRARKCPIQLLRLLAPLMHPSVRTVIIP